MSRSSPRYDLPRKLAVLSELALDLRWAWSHAGDALWRMVDADAWERTRNPWTLLQDVPRKRFAALARDPVFMKELEALLAARHRYQIEPGWYGRSQTRSMLKRVAYFSMEFGLDEALPLYAGGLGILAGDYLKTASDLGVPAVGVGLLYQVGYFRQMLDAEGRQHAMFPYNDPSSLPIEPVPAPSGGWLRVSLPLPGRTIALRVWRACVGRTNLYLLDSNDPDNSPADRGITGELYGGGAEVRLMQEIVLGVGGWRALAAMGIEPDVCHLNEGHAAFVVVERAHAFMQEYGTSFWAALWATRAGNVFTTHTPVAAAFDAYTSDLVDKYFPHFGSYVAGLGISKEALLGLGRRDPADSREPFNMAYLALRGSATANGVSRLHGAVSRRIFAPLYPRWPQDEVPVGHVTNGVHVPSWDSRWADTLWTEACGQGRWRGSMEPLAGAIQCVNDEALWALRGKERLDLVRYARERLGRQLGQRGEPPEVIARAGDVLDPDALTLGFGRRFAGYKRPNLLLTDPERLERLLGSAERPVQIIVAGKAHPDDEEGKRLVQAWAEFVGRHPVRSRAVFLEDYDMSLAQEMVQGVDVWINTPRRPWEACGTSGMKLLVNGGLNLSELDGWWAEAHRPEVGWALGDAKEHASPRQDAADAEQLYQLLENEIVPAFFERDADGIPRAWIARIRASMSLLAPEFSSNRMMRDYVERCYRPAAALYHRRRARGAKLARDLESWWQVIESHWSGVGIGRVTATPRSDGWDFTVEVHLDALPAAMVHVELYADAAGGWSRMCEVMQPDAAPSGPGGSWIYRASVPSARPSWHFTPRIVPHHPEARIPIETPLIAWPDQARSDAGR
jgi:starch phosphorylase